MPYSLTTGKPETGDWFLQNNDNITRVLDIGAGSGTYPKLIKDEYNTCKSAEWVGVEAWDTYITEFQLTELYDTVINMDARLIDWDSLGRFDVAIAGDVLEHMSKEEAVVLVDNLLNISKTLIISIPIVYMPQDEYEGNPFEIHVKPDWSHTEVIETWGDNITKWFVKSKASKVGVYWMSKR